MPTSLLSLSEEDVYVNTEELEQMYRYRAKTWRKWAATGKLKGATQIIGRRWLVPLAEVKRMIEAQKPTPLVVARGKSRRRRKVAA